MANTSKRGFASMDANKQREISSKGGKAAHRLGTAHEFTPDEAREAGRKGGLAVSQNRQHMSEIGRMGGEASRGSRRRSGSNDQSQEKPSGNEGYGESGRLQDNSGGPGPMNTGALGGSERGGERGGYGGAERGAAERGAAERGGERGGFGGGERGGSDRGSDRGGFGGNL